ncbi:hypothetical protein EVAR_30385_1 [Eumeta japonica]|uniref:Uncharacterized protein n=1 Tax=Eumeta variegata TaxID=151549 RepID=A0A4C1W3Z7_EUMVA|nr:hypothetical protein EVAR_30385_1 [Eumeta japonica]
MSNGSRISPPELAGCRTAPKGGARDWVVFVPNCVFIVPNFLQRAFREMGITLNAVNGRVNYCVPLLTPLKLSSLKRIKVKLFFEQSRAKTLRVADRRSNTEGATGPPAR